jgi:hypothetical protein
MTNPSVKLDRRLTLMLPEVPIPRFDHLVGAGEQGWL